MRFNRFLARIFLITAFLAGGEREQKSYTFAAPPETAQALALAGFDVLSVAGKWEAPVIETMVAPKNP